MGGVEISAVLIVAIIVGLILFAMYGISVIEGIVNRVGAKFDVSVFASTMITICFVAITALLIAEFTIVKLVCAVMVLLITVGHFCPSETEAQAA